MVEQQFIPLLIIVIVAFFVPILVARIPRVRIPPIVAEICMGILLGRSGLDLIREVPPIDFLAAFGFIFLMFLSGFDIDLTVLGTGRNRARTLAVPLAVVAGTMALALGSAGLVVHLGWIEDAALFALILSTTSVGIVLPIIKETSETQTRYGQTVMITALIADIATIVLLTFYVVYRSRGPGPQLFWMAGLMAGFALLFVVLRLLRRIGLLTKLLGELSHASTQIKVRGGLALLIVFVVLSQMIGTEAILGAFIAGLFLSMLVRADRELTSLKLDAIGFGFFIPIFFVMVGAKLDLPALFASKRTVLLVPLLLLLAYAVKIVPSLLFRISGFSLRQSIAGGILLSSRLALIVAASEIARSLGLIDDTVNSAIVLTAIITSIASPVIFVRVREKSRTRKPRIVVAGAGRVGREVFERIRLHTTDAVLIERDPDQLRKLSSEPRVVTGDCTDPGTLGQIGLGPSDVFIALTGSDEQNLRACLAAKRHFGVTRVIARDNNPDNTAKFESAGVIPLNLHRSIAVAAENLVLRPSLVHLFDRETAKGGLVVFEVVMRNPEHFGVKVKHIRQLRNALLLVVKQGEEIGIPHGDTVLHEDDSVVACGTPEDESRLRSLLEETPRED